MLLCYKNKISQTGSSLQNLFDIEGTKIYIIHICNNTHAKPVSQLSGLALENTRCEKSYDNSSRAQVKSNRPQSANVQMCVSTNTGTPYDTFTYFLLTFFIRGLVANWVHSTSAKTCMQPLHLLKKYQKTSGCLFQLKLLAFLDGHYAVHVLLVPSQILYPTNGIGSGSRAPVNRVHFSCRIPRCQREVLRAQTETRKGGMKEQQRQ